ncbi:MAG TPA: TIM barrel protein [Burkholderiaceae bacterium]|nr:TIM barrel protein [Burkholderiaceae bacterium]
MLNFAANISMLYAELPMLERPAAAARDGFAGVEVQFPYEASIAEWQAALHAANVPLVLLNAPPGNMAQGERGLAALPGRESEFEDSLNQAFAYAKALNVPRVHVMAGTTPWESSARKTYLNNLRVAADAARSQNLIVLIEPINTFDMPGYFLHDVHDALAVIDEVASNHLRLQLDFYHLHRILGEVRRGYEMCRYVVGHVQIAGFPGRHEPDIGEIDYACVFKALMRDGYDGWIGAEYRPRHATSAGLGWRSLLVA